MSEPEPEIKDCPECGAAMIETPDGIYCERVWKVVIQDEPYKEKVS